MRQHSGMAAAALAFLLALSCTPALAGSTSSPSGAATPTTLDKQQGGGGLKNPYGDDSPQAASPSFPLPTSSPLSHTTPTPASPTRDTAGDAAGVQDRSSAAWTVSFDTAGGGSVDRQTIPDGGQASRPSPDPARNGYLFDGWFQGDVAYDFTQPVTGSTTLTAHWTKGDGHWAISPSQGPIAGGAKVTLTPPAQRSIRFSQLSMGGLHSAAISSDGNLYTWGDNGAGELGDGTNTNRSRPVQVKKPEGTPEKFIWKQASIGWDHSAAFGSDGNLYTWGVNGNGQLGNGTTTNRNTPTLVNFPGAAAPTSVLFGQAKATGITANQDGTWQASTPKHEPGGVDVTVGWSRNGSQPDDHLQYTYIAPEYQVGFTSKNDSCPAPTGMPPSQSVTQDGQAERPYPDPRAEGCLFDGWFQSDVAYDFSQPVTHDTSLTAHWTREDTQRWSISPNHGPETGGTEVNLTPPAQRGIRFSQIRLGYNHSAAIGSDGNLYTWGRNDDGQLGNDTITNQNRPILVNKPKRAPEGFTWTQASLGDGDSAAFGSDGNLYVWGWNKYGELGDGTTTDRHTPTLAGKPQGAPDGFTWKQASLGWYHSAAIGSDGQLYTWGSNSNGQLGRDPSNAWPSGRPGPVGFPGKPQTTSVCFGQNQEQGTCLAAGKDLKPSPDGTWKVTTPPYTPGLAPVAIDWTQDGKQQETDKGNTYRYLSIASLPLTGGDGMLLLLATGLLTAGAATAAKSRQKQARTRQTA
ncbi:MULTISPECIES: InlB B-repeat-containing protein [Bifidobacterium]|uniref:InlB B-repeat-containing protein n=1 Tax=Bifidobacterium TaxID=1678 RepID=UPI0018DB960C|nr:MULTISPECIES: InlB B-repeat-containing protein [Bifidobacterium]MBI0145655.1 InlB B-repeat-containing protein [Bifidobacterium polysaccharolyticum]MBI0152874.1 InlB B-repeat-containing protein [Bifidobacterium sp. M0399]